MLKLTNVLTVFTPAANKVLLYAKGGDIYKKGDDGVEELLGGTTPSSDGWHPNANTWIYSSADTPTFVASVNADVTSTLCAGMRVKLTQGTVKYFIITAVGVYSAGATPITLYGGTDYTLTADAISGVYFSSSKIPFGFPVNPQKWTVESIFSIDGDQPSPALDTWYNVSGIYFTVPIGAWDVSYEAALRISDTAITALRGRITLSTGSSVESDNDMTGYVGLAEAGTGGIVYVNVVSVFRTKSYLYNSKTNLFLNCSSNTSTADTVGIRGLLSNTILRARCGYL